MTDPTTALVATGLSVAAFGLSVYALWSQHIRPFSPVFLVRKPQLRFIHYTQEAGTFDGSAEIKYKNWQPLFDVNVSILNNGAKPGTIVDFRLTFYSDRLSFALFPEYLIDAEKWEPLDKKRGKIAPTPHDLRKKVEQSVWAGFLLAKGASDGGHLMFQTNSAGFRELPMGTFRVVLEYTTGAKERWRPVCQYEFAFDDWSRSELAKGAGFTLGFAGADRVWPKDWKDLDRLLMDDEVEGRLGVSEAEAEPGAAPDPARM